MRLAWRSPTHVLVFTTMLLCPALSSAQAGQLLAAPGSAPVRGETIGVALDAPALAVAGGETSPFDLLRDWTLDVSATTSIPLSVGIEAQVESPIGVFGNLSVGHTPSAYLEMVDGILEGAGVYDEDLAPLVREATGSGAWNVRLGVGVRPIEGLELSVGYTYLHVATSLRSRTIERATGQRYRWRGMTEVPMTVDVHALHGRVGYRIVIEDHLVLRVAVGWTHSISVGAGLDVPDEIRAVPDNPATQIEGAVGEGFGAYGFAPEIILGAGYRF